MRILRIEIFSGLGGALTVGTPNGDVKADRGDLIITLDDHSRHVVNRNLAEAISHSLLIAVTDELKYHQETERQVSEQSIKGPGDPKPDLNNETESSETEPSKDEPGQDPSVDDDLDL